MLIINKKKLLKHNEKKKLTLFELKIMIIEGLGENSKHEIKWFYFSKNVNNVWFWSPIKYLKLIIDQITAVTIF